jgi:hypothetical protein
VSGLVSITASWKIVNKKAKKKERANNLGKSLMDFSAQLLHKSAYVCGDCTYAVWRVVTQNFFS